MNRDFVYDHDDRPTAWSRAGSTLNKWLWGALCCGLPGAPCYFCACCQRMDEPDRERPTVNQATATAERQSRPYRPHAPRGRKATPETLSAVRCALSQLQGEPAPVLPTTSQSAPNIPEPG
ncbi:uncharacterized protein LOC112056406 [Bicyclus anynana]|uniref:Uncharacterized protein LOC112056406 n=1 Tax=Bicyclus anynana TaxID=110368 RepID=A0A6J1P0S9_BICAN|nr:uncharacterized protein LOC112056406 [Bicyclus anynana]